MPNTRDFLSYAMDHLTAVMGEVNAKNMFGGTGVFQDEIMFGLIVDDALYFRADDTTVADYERAASRQFIYRYVDSDKTARMPYWTVPAQAFGHGPTLREWAERAKVAAFRSKAILRR